MASRSGLSHVTCLLIVLTLVIATWIDGPSPAHAQPAPTLTTLAAVDQPYGGVILGSDGALYGTSLTGPGASTCGYVYRLDPQGDGSFALDIVHEFAGAPTDGCQPRGELVELNGALYGMTSSGGANVDERWLVGTGTVFRVVLSSGHEVLYSFRSFALTNAQGLYPEGVGPIAGLVWGPDGHFYGTTSTGGTAGDFSPGPGTIFKVSPEDVTAAGVLTVLHHFSSETGKHIQDTLTLGSDGNLYGTSIASGISNLAGLLFRITPAGEYSRVFTLPYDQCGGPECYPLGANPWAGPTEVGGAFYVLTNHAGPPPGGYGSIVRVEPSVAGTLIHGFSGGSDGGHPHRALVSGAGGFLYGLTGGANQTGPTIFRVAPDGTLETLHEFVLGGPGLQGRLLEVSPGELISVALPYSTVSDIRVPSPQKKEKRQRCV